MLVRHAALFTALAAAGIGVVVVFSAIAITRYPPKPACAGEVLEPKCFCEHPRPGMVAQPANTFSNLGFIGVGLALGVLADRDRRRRQRPVAPDNPMTGITFYPAFYASLVALLGPGSMALHATLTRWGGHVDVASMYVWSAFLVAYGAMRVASLSRVAFVGIYGSLASVLVGSKLMSPIESDLIFAAVLVAAAGADITLRRLRPELRRDGRWLAAAAVSFGLAFAVWLPSWSGGPLCLPHSLLQGHAAWHLLCAVAAGCIGLYLRSERDAGVAGSGSPVAA